ncbi:MAG TPA: LuxR family transcriptional regulator [Propionibacteriaceae bacterium]
MSTTSIHAPVVWGRDQAVERIVALLSDTAGHTPESLVVSAARGMGRTTVVSAALARIDSRPLRLLGLPCQAASPYSSLVHSLSSAAADDEFGALLPSWLMVLRQAESSEAHVVARELLTQLGPADGRAPLRLVVDDAHAFDRQSQYVLCSLALAGAAFGLRTLLTVEESAMAEPFLSLPELRLDPPGVNPLRLLLERELDRPLPYRTAELVHRWSGGNPSLAVDLSRRLTVAQLDGASPVGLPLVPSTELTRRLAESVVALPAEELRVLASFAQRLSLPVDQLSTVAQVPTAVVDRMVEQRWLSVEHRTAEPRRRLDALVAWGRLSPSAQQELDLRLAEELRATAPAAADYFAAHGGVLEAVGRLPGRSAELYAGGDPARGAAAAALALHRSAQATVRQGLTLAELLIADGYVVAGAEQLARAGRSGEMGQAALLSRLAALAAMTSDASEVTAHIHRSRPPADGLDEWLQAVLLVCRIQLAVEGHRESSSLERVVTPLLPEASPATAALARVVTAERAVYHERPGSPELLVSALHEWSRLRPPGFDLAAMVAVVDLLGLGRIGAARELLSTAGGLQQLPFATSRAALLTLRIEVEMAAGHYRRAAELLVALDRQRPNVVGADLTLTSQAIRIRAVCDDQQEHAWIEQRLGRSAGAVMSYAARRSHTAALGFRALVLGNFGRSRELLGVALTSPALLLQGRSCLLADLVEATAADGDRAAAAQLLKHHGEWLPDRDGDRSPGLLARCAAIVAEPASADRLFEQALETGGRRHDLDRARTLLAYGRTLVGLGRRDAAGRPLAEASALFDELQLPGWQQHLRRLQLQAPQAAPSTDGRQRLSDMEQQVLDLVLQRKRNREIAGDLFVSLRTVEAHLTHIFRKLGVSTKAELLRASQRSHEA